MKKMKRFVAGFLAALGISGMLGGCKDKGNSNFLAEPDKSYSFSDENKKETPVVTDELKSNYDTFYLLLEELKKQEMGIEIEYANDALKIYDSGSGNVNYDLLNQLLEVYSLVKEKGKIYYFTHTTKGNELLDFEKVNIKPNQILYFFVVPYQGIDFENIEKAIEKHNNNPINLTINLSKDAPELPLNLMEALNGRDSKILILSRDKEYKEGAETLSKINPAWEFDEVSIDLYGDYSKHLKNLNANQLTLHLLDSFSNEASLSSSVETLTLYPQQENLKINIVLSDSVKNVWILDYEMFEEALLFGNKNCQLWLYSDNKVSLWQLAKNGFLDFSEMTFSMGDLSLYDYNCESYQDLLSVSIGDSPKGFINIKKDSEGNIIGFDTLSFEEVFTRKRTR